MAHGNEANSRSADYRRRKGEVDVAFNLKHYIERHIEWSNRVFGPEFRCEGLCRHIEKEVNEIRAEPKDLEEWIDVIILAIDGAWRAGYTSFDIVQQLKKKQLVNFNRKWEIPTDPDEPMEHIRVDVASQEQANDIDLMA